MIEVDGLVKRYGARQVLDGVDLHVDAGEIVALLGPNGAGKTTTVEIIEGYRRADSGSVRVLGTDPATGGPDHRARVGLMLQGGAGLEPRATARELVALYAGLHVSGLEPDAVLEQVGLGGVAGTRARRLSGGERQRLALAIALVGAPEVLLLDEPTAGMDPEARRAARQLIRTLRDEGRTILLTTHDLGDVEALATRVAILHHGRIVASDAPEDLAHGHAEGVRFRLHAPAMPASIDRLRAALTRGAPAAAIEPTEALPGREPDAYRITEAGASADVIAEVSRWALREGLLVVELRAGSGTLEERYLALTSDADVERDEAASA